MGRIGMAPLRWMRLTTPTGTVYEQIVALKTYGDIEEGERRRENDSGAGDNRLWEPEETLTLGGRICSTTPTPRTSFSGASWSRTRPSSAPPPPTTW